MITTIFLNVIYVLVYAITSPLRLASNVVLPSGVSTSITAIGGYLSAVDNIIPVSILLTILAQVIVVDTAIFGYKIIMWLIKRFPTQS